MKVIITEQDIEGLDTSDDPLIKVMERTLRTEYAITDAKLTNNWLTLQVECDQLGINTHLNLTYSLKSALYKWHSDGILPIGEWELENDGENFTDIIKWK